MISPHLQWPWNPAAWFSVEPNWAGAGAYWDYWTSTHGEDFAFVDSDITQLSGNLWACGLISLTRREPLITKIKLMGDRATWVYVDYRSWDITYRQQRFVPRYALPAMPGTTGEYVPQHACFAYEHAVEHLAALHKRLTDVQRQRVFIFATRYWQQRVLRGA